MASPVKTIYVNSLIGDDVANDGLSMEKPKRTPKGGWAIATAGDTILFCRGLCYEASSSFFLIINRNYITIDAYGVGAKPVFDGMAYEPANATGWVSEGNGIWSKQLQADISGKYRCKRVWVNSYNNGVRISDRSIGTAYRRTRTNGVNRTLDTIESIKATLSPTDIWYPAGDALQYKLYMYTGSDLPEDNPAKFYNGLAFNWANEKGFGGFAAVSVTGCTGVKVRNIVSWGSSTVSFSIFSSISVPTPCTNTVFEYCEGYYMFTGFFMAKPNAEDTTAPRTQISDFLVENCYADSKTSPQEQEPSTEYGWLGGAMDMYVMYDGVKNGMVRKCVSYNSFHVAFCMGAYVFNFLPTDNCHFESCLMYADQWHTYSRGVSTNHCTPNNSVRNCVFDGQCVQSQCSGAALVEYNIWINMNKSVRKANVSGWISMGAELLDRGNVNIGNDRYLRVVPEGVRIRHNLVIDPWDYPITIATFDPYSSFPVPAPVIEDGSFEYSNNVIFDRRRPNLPVYNIVTREATPGKGILENNIVFKGDGVALPTVELGNFPKGGSGTRTYVDFNTAPGCARNVFIDPMLDMTDLMAVVMKPGSPAFRAGSMRGGYAAVTGSRKKQRPHIGPWR